MADLKTDNEGITQAAMDDLRMLISLVSYNVDCAESQAAELAEVKSLAEQALKKLGG